MPKRPKPTQDAAARLTELLQAKGMIPYHENIPDKEYSYITCSIYGAPKTNELFVKLTNGTATFVEVVQSGLLYPPMADRVWGMDMLDHAVALNLANQMWEKHQTALIANPPTGKPPP